MVVFLSSGRRQGRLLFPGNNMIRYHDVRQLSTAELERTKRDLRANLGLITPHSPAHVPIQAHMKAIDAELAERAEHQKANGSELVSTQGCGQSRFSCSQGCCEAEEGEEQVVVVFGFADGGGDVLVAVLADEAHD